MTRNQKIIFLILLSTFYFLLSWPVLAAQMSFDAKITRAQIGEKFEVNLFLNTEGEELNAIEGSVIFPSNLIAFKEINDSNSIISLWIERPKMTSEGKIEFSGIIPGGYKEANGFIFEVFFTAKTNGKDIIEFHNVKALKNDGLGTPAEVKISNFQFLISKQIPISQILKPLIKDIESPESFSPEIAKDETLFDGKWFLVFATQDKGLGMSHYEIKETRIRRQGTWIETKSPYVLKDQKLKSYVYVKAMDKAGNERISIVEPRYPLKWYEQPLTWGIIILLAVALYIIVKILWTRKFYGQQRI